MPASKKDEDPEIRAMRVIAEALILLDISARNRVISWVLDRYPLVELSDNRQFDYSQH